MNSRGIARYLLYRALALVLVLALGFTGFAVITAFVVEDKLLARLLDVEQANIAAQLQKGESPSVTLPGVRYYPGYDALPKLIQAHVQQSDMAAEVFAPGPEHYHVRRLSVAGQSAYLVFEVSSWLVVSDQPSLFVFFLIGAVLALLVAYLVARMLATRLLQPITRLTRAVALHQQGQKVQWPQLDMEFGYLAAHLQQGLEELSSRWQRERAFSTTVSHELRTPLTILKNAAGLIEARGYKAEDLAVIDGACMRMEATIELLFAVARAQSVPVRDCSIRKTLSTALALAAEPALQRFEFDFQIIQDDRLQANPELLELLMVNLLNNSARHAARPELQVIYDGATLIWRNPAHGSVGDDITNIGVKGRTSHGDGQGLYIVARIIELLGWTYRIGEAPTEFEFVIEVRNFT